jgi:hypothetical protein
VRRARLRCPGRALRPGPHPRLPRRDSTPRSSNPSTQGDPAGSHRTRMSLAC